MGPSAHAPRLTGCPVAATALSLLCTPDHNHSLSETTELARQMIAPNASLEPWRGEGVSFVARGTMRVAAPPRSHPCWRTGPLYDFDGSCLTSVLDYIELG